MNTPITEAHRKLATDLCRNVTGSNRALHHVSKFAQLIADSEATAIRKQIEALEIAMRRWLNMEKERDQLRAEVEDLKARITRDHGIVELMEAELKDLKSAGGPPFIRSEAIRNLRDHVRGLKARAERAEAELEAARKDSKRYRYIAWKSDTNPIMIIRLNDNILLHGYDADETIDSAMKEGAK